MSLREALGTPAAKSAYVRRLFSTIADRYDLITVVLSYGQDVRWKRRLVRLATPAPDESVLDLACGTGDIAFLLARTGATVTGLDITHRMIELARARQRREAGHCRFVVGDMCALPFSSHQFDLVTTGYGLRNVPDLALAIGEIARVLRPGGRLLSLDFNRPDSRAIRAVYLAYLTAAGGALGWVLHRDPETYRYIPESIRRYPGAAAVAALLEKEGFRANWHPVLGGLMAIHDARLRDPAPLPFRPIHTATRFC